MSKSSPSSSSAPSSPTKNNNNGLLGSQIFFTGLLGIIITGFLGYRDIETKMGFYGAYHREPWNQVIHFFGVPGILWSAFLYGVHLPVPVIGDTMSITFLPGVPPHEFNYGLLGLVVYSFSYLIVDLVGGAFFAPFLYLMYASSVILRENDRATVRDKKKSDDKIMVPWSGTGSVLKFAVFVHVFCWYIQIHPGHKVIEGAKPALMDSITDSFTAGPLFAFHELIFALGFRQDLYQRVQIVIAEYTAEICAAGSTIRACTNI